MFFKAARARQPSIYCFFFVTFVRFIIGYCHFEGVNWFLSLKGYHLNLWKFGPWDPAGTPGTPGTLESLDLWTFGSLDLGTLGPLDLGTLDLWTFQPWDLWTLGL